MKTSLTIVKIGGNVLDNPIALDEVLSQFVALSGPKILVHGGGKETTSLSEKLGIKAAFHEGRRITTAEELKLATMVYAGWINKTIVAALQAKGAFALGLCGADVSSIVSSKRPVGKVDFGWVGDVQQVNVHAIMHFLKMDVVPVFSAITHDGKGQLLNTNADTIASEIAQAMVSNFAVKLIYCFEKNGVLWNEKDPSQIIPSINLEQFNSWKASGILYAGILPKISNGLKAKAAGVSKVCITNAQNLDLSQSKTEIV